jgi:hypothetical protein
VALNTITQIRWLHRLVKIVYEISCMIFSFRFYLDVMVSEINRVNGSKKGPTIKMIIFDCKFICIWFFPLNSLEKILSEVFQQICCSFYWSRDLRGLKGNNVLCYLFKSYLIYSVTHVKHQKPEPESVLI